MKKKTGLIIAILCMAIGFAAVSTTLYINGTATIKSNDKDFKEKKVLYYKSLYVYPYKYSKGLIDLISLK